MDKVATVAFPVAINGVYDYNIPEKFAGKITAGLPVYVELRKQKIWGVVLETKKTSAANLTLKDILDIKEGHFTDSNKTLLQFYKWMAAYYKCPLGRVFKPLLSKGVMKLKRAAKIKEVDDAIIDKKIKLSDEQQFCVDTIVATFDSDKKKPFLLYGITGSGKTNVYTELANKTLSHNKGVIILVPEISLTPQTITRFTAEVGTSIAVLHSRMSDGERRDNLQEIVTGRKRAIIGVRSALLVPMDNVGLIIVDEEHDGSYKQSDTDPRYNARDMAVMRGAIQNATVVLGSATPSLESYHNALAGKYNLLTLQKRHGTAKLPSVKIIDMREEHKANNWTIISHHLATRIDEELSRGFQIILLLNRRGFSASILCKQCGYFHACPNCSVNMRYHKADTQLKCHLCGREEPTFEKCPKCGGLKIKFKGTGIQKAQEFIAERFPTARVLRMDQDTTRRKGTHAAIIDAFARGEADILLGTQMVAKGLNFPNVTLVGVMQADIGLYFPDFRASERTFQLLTQVAGRAGRAQHLGEVVIQTYCPEEAALRYASDHDYLSFYDEEIKHRAELHYPPFGKIARVITEGVSEDDIRKFLHVAARSIITKCGTSIKILGPAPAVLSKVDNIYRYSMILKTSSPKKLSDALSLVENLSSENKKQNFKCIIDVDPVNMM